MGVVVSVGEEVWGCDDALEGLSKLPIHTLRRTSPRPPHPPVVALPHGSIGWPSVLLNPLHASVPLLSLVIQVLR